ncbi:hypothetical protein ACYFX5_05370 [Bremerella sp. T1]|uniref:hypothetical protein n=1 Tax=Bremerella sp. TYQ1 TaxID=3119568 RepID=UPI001CCBFE55|nr:hypothetical protein [Bremerella volcania]UBM37687.1 hypothetical protein LA756_07310 [Bremerella volcania]
MPPANSEIMADFLNRVESLPWFHNLGQDPPWDSHCRQIQDWSEWPGPEDPSVSEIAYRQQSLYDELMTGEHSEQLKELWDRIHAIVIRVASSRVPYDADRDSWHPPNAAVWQAAWTAGLMGLCLYLGHPTPPELRTQWEWFALGHWPCDWDGDFPSGKLVIY